MLLGLEESVEVPETVGKMAEKGQREGDLKISMELGRLQPLQVVRRADLSFLVGSGIVRGRDGR